MFSLGFQQTEDQKARSLRRERPSSRQRPGPVRLPGDQLPGLSLPVPQVSLAKVRRGVSLQQEMGVRADRERRRRDTDQVDNVTLQFAELVKIAAIHEVDSGM